MSATLCALRRTVPRARVRQHDFRQRNCAARVADHPPLAELAESCQAVANSRGKQDERPGGGIYHQAEGLALDVKADHGIPWA